MGVTRWVSHESAAASIVAGLKGITQALRVLSDRDPTDALASFLHKELQKPENLYGLFLMGALLPILRAFSKCLQDPSFCFSEIVALCDHFAKKIQLLIDDPEKVCARYAASHAQINDLNLPSVDIQSIDSLKTWHTDVASMYLTRLIEVIQEMMGESPVLAACAIFDPRSSHFHGAWQNDTFNIEPVMKEILVVCQHCTQDKEYTFPTLLPTVFQFPPLWTVTHVDC